MEFIILVAIVCLCAGYFIGFADSEANFKEPAEEV